MPDPGPSSPWYWPEAPPAAQFFPSRAGLDPGWIVYDLPPVPWPFVVSFPRSIYGPPGTFWTDTNTRYVERFLESETATTYTVFEQDEFLSAEGLVRPSGTATTTPLEFVTPGEAPGMTIDVLRATIHAKVGLVEESCNVLHYIPEPEIEITPEMVTGFGNVIRDQWAAMIDSTNEDIGGGVGHKMEFFFGDAVVWDEVRAAHVQLVNGAPKWVGDTHFSIFGPPPVQGVQQMLPPQVAFTLSFGTGVRGASHRGRTYLGPLSINVLGAVGQTTPTFARGIAGAFKRFMVDEVLISTQPCRLVILSPKTNARYLVTDVRAGQVFDTQRRRRKSFPEQYQLAGTGV